MSGFKAFLLRGNLVELAVAFIMGVSFAAVVTAFADLLLAVVVKIFGGNPDVSGWNPGGLPVGDFLTTLIAFVILAVVVYFFVVLPYQKAKERFFPSEVGDEGVSEEVALLSQIRDALTARGGNPPTA
jgi:large conductance mechanosensitive channel